MLIGEIIRDKHRGKANGIVHSGWAVGWGAAAILYTALFSLVPETVAWRILFGVGVLPAIAVFFVRRFVDEPAVFLASKKQYNSGEIERPSFLEIFSRPMLRTTILASLLTIGTQGGYYAIMIWLPTYLKTVRGLSILGTGGYLAVIIVASFFGYVVGAYLTDILGRRKSFFLFAICSTLTVLAYMFIPVSDSVLLVLGAPLGFFASGITAVLARSSASFIQHGSAAPASVSASTSAAPLAPCFRRWSVFLARPCRWGRRLAPLRSPLTD